MFTGTEEFADCRLSRSTLGQLAQPLRVVRCMHPRSCKADSVPETLRCRKHLKTDDLLALAQEYAVASVLYYGHDSSFMSDPRFDGTCSVLLKRKAWQKIDWLEEESLRAGSGYVMKQFPKEYHQAAREWLSKKALKAGARVTDTGG